MSFLRSVLKAGGAAALPLNPQHARVLTSPDEFYETLLDGIARARRRVTLASLYVGDGGKERHLVDCLARRLRERRELRARVLLDHSRATRGGVNRGTARVFAPLLHGDGGGSGSDGGDVGDGGDDAAARCRVQLFQMPQLRGAWKQRVFPARYKEGLGVFHAKAYVFDDTVLISGANLSDDYFTDRQDRYLLFGSGAAPALADYYHGFADVVGRHAHTLVSVPPPDGGGTARLAVEPPARSCAADLSRELLSLGGAGSGGGGTVDDDDDDVGTGGDRAPAQPTPTAWVSPNVQLAPVGVRQDEAVTVAVLDRALRGGLDVHLATAYFNLGPRLVHCISGALAARQPPERPHATILTASPSANGFHGAGGISGALPMAFSFLVQSFWQTCADLGLLGHVRILEYARPGWTFHGKGLWAADAAARETFSFVGSPNFGRRSVNRDFESHVAVCVPSDSDLAGQFRAERDAMCAHGAAVDERTWEGRRLRGFFNWQRGTWIPWATRAIGSFL